MIIAVIPVVSGNVSLYNETDSMAIQPCPVIGMIGVIDDWTKAKGCGLANAGKALFVVGHSDDVKDGWLGCSVYALEIAGREGGAPPSVDPALEGRNGTLIRQAIESELIEAAHDISDGGLVVALAEMVMAGQCGAKITCPEGGSLHGWAFGEDQALLIMVGVAIDTIQQVNSYLLNRHYDGLMKTGKTRRSTN